jgi:ribonuclease HI
MNTRPQRRDSRPSNERRASTSERPLSAAIERPDVILSVDGACSGNPGPGGWAAIIVDGDTEREISGAEPLTTNQRMELTAAIEGLAAIAEGRRVHLYSDSAYVVNCFRDRWWERWERAGWTNAGKQPIANRDLWERLLREARSREVEWHKVRGHSGDPLNDRVDALARAAIAKLLQPSSRPLRSSTR